jgi:hypothetical protein
LNKKSIGTQDISKILAINNQDQNINSHIKNSVVYFASQDLGKFFASFEINTVYDFMADFKKRVSIIEGLLEAKKMRELDYLIS